MAATTRSAASSSRTSRRPRRGPGPGAGAAAAAALAVAAARSGAPRRGGHRSGLWRLRDPASTERQLLPRWMQAGSRGSARGCSGARRMHAGASSRPAPKEAAAGEFAKAIMLARALLYPTLPYPCARAGRQRVRQDQDAGAAAAVPARVHRARRAAAGHPREPGRGGRGRDRVRQDHAGARPPPRRPARADRPAMRARPRALRERLRTDGGLGAWSRDSRAAAACHGQTDEGRVCGILRHVPSSRAPPAESALSRSSPCLLLRVRRLPWARRKRAGSLPPVRA